MVALAPVRMILVAALVAFGYALAGSFHFDDWSLFTDPAVTASAGWLAVWEPLRTRPLTYLSFWMNYQTAGQSPFAWHAVNLVLHLGCVLLVFRVLRRLLPERAAQLAALLFAIHPMAAEPVAYIFARATLLMTLCSLLAVAAWLEDRPWLAVAAFAAALLAKEECVALPAALLLIDYTRSRPIRPRPLAALFGLSLLAGLHLLWVTSRIAGSAAAFGAGVQPLDYLATQAFALVRYARLLLLPWGFTVDPEVPAHPIWLAAVLWTAILALAALAWRACRRRPEALWLLTALVLLLPVSSLVPVDDAAVDRRLYLPMFALAAALALLLVRLPRPVVPLLAVVLIGLSIARMHVWRTEQTLWAEAVERSPNKLRPRLQLARVTDDATAPALFEDARHLAPEDPRVPAEAGAWYLRHRQPARALNEFGRALALAPRNPLALNNRGAALAALGQRDAARRDFEAALRLDPSLAGARENLRHLLP